MVFCMINKCDFLCNLVVVKLLYLIGKSGMGGFHSLSEGYVIRESNHKNHLISLNFFF